MTDEKMIPPDFKPSLLGSIPESWEVIPVGKAFQICNNLRFPINADVRKTIQGVFPYYGPTKVQDFINEYRVEGKYALIGEDGDHFLKWKELPMTLLVEGKFNVNNHAHLLRGEKNLTEWFYYYFNHKELTTYLTRQGAGRYKLTKESLSKIPCLIPPILEQALIIACLSTWDRAISITTALIAQQELRKKWLMQHLLSGKKRMKGFDVDVEFHILGHYIKEVSERNTDNKINNVLSVTNSRGFINQSEQFDRVIASDDNSNYKIIRRGQFAYNPSRVNVGSLDLLRHFENGILSPMYVVFENNSRKLDAEFLYYQLKSFWFNRHIPMFVQGSVRDSLAYDGLCGMKFFVPSIEEQTAIARVFKAADKEIDLLKTMVNKLKEQKKGLMQVLLTGKKRLQMKKS